MGVAPTGAIFKGLTFDGESSKNYGIYITGSAVFNAPARDVEMVTIPGRNGTFALDRGRFENIEVTYPAGLYGDTEADFAQGISDFRNFLASRQGYVELSDDYNPGEYRLAVYKNGLDVTPEQLKAGEFEIVFECKPQRFLTSGETAITVTSGDTITNPTLFDASPLIETVGYGDIDINGETITIAQGTPLGNVQVSQSQDWTGSAFSFTQTVTIDDTFILNGDTISWVQDAACLFNAVWNYDHSDVTNIVYSQTGVAHWSGGSSYGIFFKKDETPFTYGTSQTYAGTVTIAFTSTQYGTLTGGFSMSMAYDGTDTFTLTVTETVPAHMTETTSSRYVRVRPLWADSTYFGNVNIDLDFGEAYMELNGETTSYNNAVSLPAELPTLAPGANTITFDNTFTSVKITPRWWKV